MASRELMEHKPATAGRRTPWVGHLFTAVLFLVGLLFTVRAVGLTDALNPWPAAWLDAQAGHPQLFAAFPDSNLIPAAHSIFPSSAPAQERERRTIAIEDVTPGRRLLAQNPTGEVDSTFGSDIEDPTNWRLITLHVDNPDGSESDARIVRPLWWMQPLNIEAGRTVHLVFPECGVDGPALVRAVDPCPTIQPGEGSIVTGTFRHTNAAVVDLYIEGLDEPIGTTPIHPFWSADREQFIEAASLEIGEHVLLADGSRAPVTAIVPRAGPHTVYNLEVQFNHVYHVTAAGVLVHNAEPCNILRPAQITLNRNRHERAVESFIQKARSEGWNVLGTRASVRTPFGRREYDVLLEHPDTGRLVGVEIKTSKSAMKRTGRAARHQAAADRWVKRHGAEFVGRFREFEPLQEVLKIMWQ